VYERKMGALEQKVSAPELKKSGDVVSSVGGMKKKSIHYPFWFGGSASCFAACFTHPLDLGMFLFPIGMKLSADSPGSEGMLQLRRR
jgi:dicarboxylate transporter 10